jgi:isopenicillin-N epimerase
MQRQAAAPSAADLASHWALDPDVDFLNHGSFGAAPRAVLAAQQAWRDRMETEPVRFLSRDLEGLLDAARGELAVFLGADPDGLAFVPNATTGVNAVLASLPLASGDELLVTDHAYGACLNAVRFAAERARARVVVAEVPFPLRDAGEVTAAVLAAVTPRTRLALVDHVTSPTALIFPVEELVPKLEERGVPTLVDGAHAPGMLPLAVDALAPAWYAGNCHKWLCAPKGAGFVWARADRRQALRPVVISHGAASPRTDRSRFRLEFDWTGTHDPTPYLAVPAAIRFLGGLLAGGWPEVMARNRSLALAGRDLLCAAVRTARPAPDEMVGAMASVPLPGGGGRPRSMLSIYDDPLHAALDAQGIQAAIVPWHSGRLLRLSAQLYNSAAQFRRLADVLRELVA